MLEAGNYSVTISDSLGCVSSVNFVVAEPEAIALVVDTIIHESGAGENGAVQITVTGGTPPYMYDWILNNNTISTDQNPDGLTMGEYIVNVVDANGCAFQSDTIIVQGITAVKNVVSKINISIVPNPVSNFTILSWDKDVSINTVEIWSVQGAKVIGYKLSNNSIRQFTINTEYLTQGLYYVVAAGHAGKGVLKLVKI